MVPPKSAGPRTCMTQVTLAAAAFMMQATGLRWWRAREDVRRPGLLDRAGARGGGRALERADRAQRPVRRIDPLHGLPAGPRDRAQHPEDPPGRVRRGGHHAPAAVLRAAGVVR